MPTFEVLAARLWSLCCVIQSVSLLYSGEASDITPAQLQHYVSLVETVKLSIQLGPVFDFESLQAAHAVMDENRANGKMVIEVGG